MSWEQGAVELVNGFGLLCLAASLLYRILPSPEEIPRSWYRVFYHVVRRCSLAAAPVQPPGNGSRANGGRP